MLQFKLLLIGVLIVVPHSTQNPSSSSSPRIDRPQYHLISCTDTVSSFESSKNWVPSSPPKPAQNDTWCFEGSSPTTSSEVKLRFNPDSASPLRPSTSLYIEYLNESPRRVLVEQARDGAFNLLQGVGSKSRDSWESSVVDIENELAITATLKMPQKLFMRKLVIFRRVGAGDFTRWMSTNTCQEIAKPPPPPTTRTTAPIKAPSPTTTPRPPQCVKSSTNLEGSCPECKCVCNCNCAKCD